MLNEEADVRGEEIGLFRPYKMGKFDLSHRVVLAPMTRCRAIGGIPNQGMVEYYTQRATKGGLLITEATDISPEAAGYPHSPGIYTNEQMEAWKKIVDSVHAKGAFIFCQIWHAGRASRKEKSEGDQTKYSVPQSLSLSKIQEVVDQFRQAAVNAIQAGFDGVEIHGAHGDLIDQFLKDGTNNRTDKYGGSYTNRCRFLTQILHSISTSVHPTRMAIRISPNLDQGNPPDSNPLTLGLAAIDTLNHLQTELSTQFAYLHVAQNRYVSYDPNGQVEIKRKGSEKEESMLTISFRRRYQGTFMNSGGYTMELAVKDVKRGYADLISFGRLFVSNPDLVNRFRINAALTHYDRKTFYTNDPVVGYIDYPNFGEGSVRYKLIPRL